MEIGFYWVKTHNIEGVQVGEWQPAFNAEEGWYLCGSEVPKPNEYFSEIGERITSGEYQPIRGNT